MIQREAKVTAREQALDSIRIGQPRRLQIQSATFMVGKHFFNPKTFGVTLPRFFGVREIGDQQPRLGLRAIPDRDQIDPMRSFPIHGDFDRFPNPRPSAPGQVSRFVPIPQVLDAGSGLDPQYEIQSQFLLDPSRQGIE